MDTTPAPVAAPRWRVLPIGAAATLCRTARTALFCGAIGLVGLFPVLLVVGFFAQEVLPESATSVAIDLIGRGALVWLIALALGTTLLGGLLAALEGPLMARALDLARRRGVPTSDVPVPSQWDAAHRSNHRAYQTYAFFSLVVLGLFGIFAFVDRLVSGSVPEGMPPLWAIGLLMLLIGAGMPVVPVISGVWRFGNAAYLEAHWPVRHREAAAERALNREDIAAAGASEKVPGETLTRAVGALYVVAVLAAIGYLLGFLVFVARAHPGSKLRPARLAPRRYLGPEQEQLMDKIMIGITICAAVAVLALAAAIVLGVVTHRLERRSLRGALEDPSAPPPPYAVLSSTMTPGPRPEMRVLWGIAAAVAALGGALVFVDRVSGLPGWGAYGEAGPQLRTLGPLGIGIMLVSAGVMVLGILVASLHSVRDRELRDELVQRWPVLPAEEDAGA